jgi:hypothetical protein
MLEIFLAAEIPEIRIIGTELTHALIEQPKHVPKQMQPHHQTGWDHWPSCHGEEVRYLIDVLYQIVAQIDDVV